MKRPGFLIAVAGVILIILWKVIFYISAIDLALGFAFFVLVPLLLDEVVQQPDKNRGERWLKNVMQSSLPFAGAGAIAVTLPSGGDAGWWAAVWFFYTCLIAFGGLMRLLARGFRPIEEAIIDLGLIYVAVGAMWLLVSSAGWAQHLPYTESIVQLTAIHFHYAAFVLPLVTGFFGRYRAEGNRIRKRYFQRPYAVLALGIAVGPFLVALGLAQGPPVETYAVALYVIVLAWLCIWWFWMSVDFKTWISTALQLSSIILLGTMGLSFLYSLGMLYKTEWINIGEMFRYHGLFNAFGFSILAVLAWRGVHAPIRHSYTAFPISQLRANGYVGNDVVSRKEWISRHEYVTGLIPDWRSLKSNHFNPERVGAGVRDFYLHTTSYNMETRVIWHKGFRRSSRLIRRITNRWGQVNIPASGDIHMEGDLVSISDHKDGRKQVRAWVRKNAQTNAPIFTALYSYHKKYEDAYMNIALPFPRGVMTGVLMPAEDGKGGFLLTSHLRKDARGDEGIYFTLGDWTVRLPLREWFHVVEEKEGTLRAEHHISLGRIPFLSIHYAIKKIR
ncbi:YndJ family protein [Halobacillus mangrovi]|uniref:YndJ family protein n=1 Tax=Halobacillus mangrovi TaxID=402384 RepID=UPI003D966D29